MTGPEIKKIKVKSFLDGIFTNTDTAVAPECILQIFLNEKPLTSIACLGAHIDELAVGFLHTEGFIERWEDIREIRTDPSIPSVHIVTRMKTPLISSETIIFFSGAKFGQRPPSIPEKASSSPDISPQEIFDIMEEMVRKSQIHELTRGTHSAALATRKGIICLREDIGRHNCLDMLDGYCLLQGINARDKFIFRTGRVSSEIVRKVIRMGSKIVVSLSVPTFEAVELAREAGVTLIGRVTERGMVVFTNEAS